MKKCAILINNYFVKSEKVTEELEFGRRVGRNIIKPVRIAVRPAYRNEWDDAMALAWRTFMQFEARDCTPEGIESFQDFITDEVLHKMFMLGSYQLLARMTTAGW